MKTFRQLLWEYLLPLRKLRFHTWRHVAKLFGRKPALFATSLAESGENAPAGCEVVCRLEPESKSITFTLPKCLSGEIDPLFITNRNKASYPRCLARLQNAVLDGEDGLLFLPDGQVLLENHFFFTGHVITQPSYFRRRTVAKTISGPVFTLLAYCPGAHYHWMTDVLYRLYCSIEHLPKDITYLVPAHLSSVQRQTLMAFGIEPDQTLEVSAKERVCLSDLWYASPVLPSGYDSPEVTAWVSESLKKYLLPHEDQSRPNHRFYITRQTAKTRRVVNEAEVCELLKNFGYIVLDCATMDLASQVANFAAAREIIAPHGAGLVNLMFAPPGVEY